MEPLGPDDAWRLVRAARGARRSGPAGVEAGPTRVSAGADWLEVDPRGGWRTARPATDEARDLLDLYLPVALPRELVMGQLGQSLDGRIATEEGHSHYVTGDADLERLHRLRALVDAVVVGAGTATLDDPRLTVRRVEGENPVRVVLDPEGRVPPDRQLFRDGGRTILVRRGESEDAAPPAPRVSAETLLLPADEEGGIDPRAVVAALRDRGLRRVLVEGGGVTVSRFLAAGVLDRLHVCVAPLLIGSGRPSLTLPPIARLDQALRPRCRHVRLGDDLLFDLELR